MKVLISPGFGAGFSTWGDSRMAVDKDIIKMFEEGHSIEEIRDLCKHKGYIDEYEALWGFDDLRIEEIPEGTLFQIREYDGAEWIEIFNPDNWFKAIDQEDLW